MLSADQSSPPSRHRSYAAKATVPPHAPLHPTLNKPHCYCCCLAAQVTLHKKKKYTPVHPPIKNKQYSTGGVPNIAACHIDASCLLVIHGEHRRLASTWFLRETRGITRPTPAPATAINQSSAAAAAESWRTGIRKCYLAGRAEKEQQPDKTIP